MAHFLKKISTRPLYFLSSFYFSDSDYSSLKFDIFGGRHSSMVSSVPTILRPWVQIPSTPSTPFSICIIEIVMRKGGK